MKRRFMGLLVAATLAVSLVGCGGGSTEETTTAAATQEGSTEASGETSQGEDSLEDAYSEFEDQERTKEIQSFAEEHALDSDVMQHLISEYEFSNILSKETIRQNIREKLTFIKMKRLIESVREFVVENVQKYQ